MTAYCDSIKGTPLPPAPVLFEGTDKKSRKISMIAGLRAEI